MLAQPQTGPATPSLSLLSDQLPTPPLVLNPTSPSGTPPLIPVPSHVPDLGSVLLLTPTLLLSLPHSLTPPWSPDPPRSQNPRPAPPSPSPPGLLHPPHCSASLGAQALPLLDRGLLPSRTGFFLLGGLCVVWGGASYVVGLAALRGPMQLSLGGAAAGVGAVLAVGLLWACAVGLYMGQLELDVELVPEDDGTATAEGPDEAGRPPPE